MTRFLSRRQALAAAGAAALALAGIRCGGRDGDAGPGGSPRSAENSRACILTPEQAEGPFHLPGSPFRRRIAEDRPGVPLELRLAVQDAESCRPVPNAVVEVWHCDADGRYSGVQGAPGTFCRGAQRADARGRVRFATVFPGWYPGRAAHVHVKVHAGGEAIHTGQLYFPDSVTAAVHRAGPYAARGPADTANAEDGLFADGGDRSVLAVRRAGPGWVGELALGIRPV